MDIENIKNIKNLKYGNKKITSSEAHVNVYEDDEFIEKIVTSNPERFLQEKVKELVRSEPYAVVISCKLEVKHEN